MTEWTPPTGPSGEQPGTGQPGTPPAEGSPTPSWGPPSYPTDAPAWPPNPQPWSANPHAWPGSPPTWPGSPPPAGAPYPQQWAYPYAPVERPVDGYGITALVLGILGIVPVAIGFGIAALRKRRRAERRGAGLAIAGLSLSLAWVLVYISVAAFHVGEPNRLADNTVTSEGQVAPNDLRIGDCVRVPRDISGVIRTLTVVPCSQPHNGQTFTILTADPAPYPGDGGVVQLALAACKKAFPAFLGKEDTALHVIGLATLQREWERGNRRQHCLLVDRQRDITGDIRSDG